MQQTGGLRALWQSLILLGVPSILGWYAFTFSHTSLLPDVVLTIDRAHFLSSDQTTPPDLDIIISNQDLPHDWSTAPTLESDTAWYTAIINLNVPPNRLWGIYLPSVNMNAEVFLNSELLGSGGSMQAPFARNWSRPLYFAIPNGMLQAGQNVIQIHVKAEPKLSGLLAPVYLGAHTDLRPSFERHYFLRISLVAMITGALFILAFIMALLWWLRRQESLIGWFSLTCVVWGIHNLNLLVVNAPISTRSWDAIINFLFLGWVAVLATVFMHRYLELERPKIERTLLLFAIAASCLLFILAAFASETVFYAFAIHIWDSALLLIGLYPLCLVFLHFCQHRDTTSLLLSTSGFCVIVFAFHDWLLMNRLISRVEGFYIQYGAPSVLIGFGWLLIINFVRARDEAETLNRELEQRVQRKSAELEQNYQRLRELEHEQILASERERMMRDMHDGMGGHLVSTLSMVEAGQAQREQILDALRAALDDLRLMIDSLDPVDDDLAMVLGMFRSRLEPRLTGTGLQLRWQVQDVPPIPDFGPHKVLQVLRILQEAVSNTLKYAQASVLRIRTDSEKGRSYIEISDNGRGMAATQCVTSKHRTGRGLDNMRERALMIGAELTIDSDAQGVKITLWLPTNNHLPADSQG